MIFIAFEKIETQTKYIFNKIIYTLDIHYVFFLFLLFINYQNFQLRLCFEKRKSNIS